MLRLEPQVVRVTATRVEAGLTRGRGWGQGEADLGLAEADETRVPGVTCGPQQGAEGRRAQGVQEVVLRNRDARSEELLVCL